MKLQRLLAQGMAFVWLSVLPVGLAASDVAEEAKFQPPAAVSVSAIPEQPVSAQHGALVLDVRVSATGEVEDIEVRRDLPPLTKEVIRAVKTWKFAPAKLEGRCVPSRITVAVNFNPPSASSADVPLHPLLPQEDETRVKSSFQPAEVTFAKMPAFVYGAFGPGTVVVAVTVDEKGKVQSTKVLRDAPPFTGHAVEAAADWKFVPATLKGKPLQSTVIIAFVFRIFNWPPAVPY
jgi:TonB family protein